MLYPNVNSFDTQLLPPNVNVDNNLVNYLPADPVQGSNYYGQNFQNVMELLPNRRTCNNPLSNEGAPEVPAVVLVDQTTYFPLWYPQVLVCPEILQTIHRAGYPKYNISKTMTAISSTLTTSDLNNSTTIQDNSTTTEMTSSSTLKENVNKTGAIGPRTKLNFNNSANVDDSMNIIRYEGSSDVTRTKNNITSHQQYNAKTATLTASTVTTMKSRIVVKNQAPTMPSDLTTENESKEKSDEDAATNKHNESAVESELSTLTTCSCFPVTTNRTQSTSSPTHKKEETVTTEGTTTTPKRTDDKEIAPVKIEHKGTSSKDRICNLNLLITHVNGKQTTNRKSNGTGKHIEIIAYATRSKPQPSTTYSIETSTKSEETSSLIEDKSTTSMQSTINEEESKITTEEMSSGEVKSEETSTGMCTLVSEEETTPQHLTLIENENQNQNLNLNNYDNQQQPQIVLYHSNVLTTPMNPAVPMNADQNSAVPPQVVMCQPTTCAPFQFIAVSQPQVQYYVPPQVGATQSIAVFQQPPVMANPINLPTNHVPAVPSGSQEVQNASESRDGCTLNLVILGNNAVLTNNKTLTVPNRNHAVRVISGQQAHAVNSTSQDVQTPIEMYSLQGNKSENGANSNGKKSIVNSKRASTLSTTTDDCPETTSENYQNLVPDSPFNKIRIIINDESLPGAKSDTTIVFNNNTYTTPKNSTAFTSNDNSTSITPKTTNIYTLLTTDECEDTTCPETTTNATTPTNETVSGKHNGTSLNVSSSNGTTSALSSSTTKTATKKSKSGSRPSTSKTKTTCDFGKIANQLLYEIMNYEEEQPEDKEEFAMFTNTAQLTTCSPNATVTTTAAPSGCEALQGNNSVHNTCPRKNDTFPKEQQTFRPLFNRTTIFCKEHEYLFCQPTVSTTNVTENGKGAPSKRTTSTSPSAAKVSSQNLKGTPLKENNTSRTLGVTAEGGEPNATSTLIRNNATVSINESTVPDTTYATTCIIYFNNTENIGGGNGNVTETATNKNTSNVRTNETGKDFNNSITAATICDTSVNTKSNGNEHMTTNNNKESINGNVPSTDSTSTTVIITTNKSANSPTNNDSTSVTKNSNNGNNNTYTTTSISDSTTTCTTTTNGNNINEISSINTNENTLNNNNITTIGSTASITSKGEGSSNENTILNGKPTTISSNSNVNGKATTNSVAIKNGNNTTTKKFGNTNISAKPTTPCETTFNGGISGHANVINGSRHTTTKLEASTPKNMNSTTKMTTVSPDTIHNEMRSEKDQLISNATTQTNQTEISGNNTTIPPGVVTYKACFPVILEGGTTFTCPVFQTNPTFNSTPDLATQTSEPRKKFLGGILDRLIYKKKEQALPTEQCHSDSALTTIVNLSNYMTSSTMSKLQDKRRNLKILQKVKLSTVAGKGTEDYKKLKQAVTSKCGVTGRIIRGNMKRHMVTNSEFIYDLSETANDTDYIGQTKMVPNIIKQLICRPTTISTSTSTTLATRGNVKRHMVTNSEFIYDSSDTTNVTNDLGQTKSQQLMIYTPTTTSTSTSIAVATTKPLPIAVRNTTAATSANNTSTTTSTIRRQSTTNLIDTIRSLISPMASENAEGVQLSAMADPNPASRPIIIINENRLPEVPAMSTKRQQQNGFEDRDSLGVKNNPSWSWTNFLRTNIPMLDRYATTTENVCVEYMPGVWLLPNETTSSEPFLFRHV